MKTIFVPDSLKNVYYFKMLKLDFSLFINCKFKVKTVKILTVEYGLNQNGNRNQQAHLLQMYQKLREHLEP